MADRPDPSEGEAGPAPIPPAFSVGTSRRAVRPGKPPPPPIPGGAGWWRRIPGFRTGRKWKQVLAILGYLLIAIWVVQTPTKPALGVLGLLSLAAAWLATNAFGLRTRIPMFRSANRFEAAGAWSGLAFAILLAASLAGAPPNSSYTGVGSGPSVSPSPIGVAQEQSPTTAASASQSPSPSPKPSPSPSPSPSPVPSPSPSPISQPAPPPVVFDFCGAPDNPWHYNFCTPNSGRYIYSPNAGFCGYFNCIASFWRSTNGYVDECNDGTYSHSGGRSGACSYHGGEMRPLWD